MSDQILRSHLIRLAYTKPETREVILPLLAKTAGAFDNVFKGKQAAAQKIISLGGKSFATNELEDRRHEVFQVAADMLESVGGFGKYSAVDKAFGAVGKILDLIKYANGRGSRYANKLVEAMDALGEAVTTAKTGRRRAATDMTLRNRMIRLAYEKPHLRETLLPLLRK